MKMVVSVDIYLYLEYGVVAPVVKIQAVELQFMIWQM